MKKIVVLGLLLGIAMLIVGMVMGSVTNAIFPGIQAQYQNPNLFRPWSDPLMSFYFLHPFILGVILSWLWDKTKKLTKRGKGCCRQGITFGVGYWVITLPGMIISYASFPLSIEMVVSWSLSIIVQLIAAGILLEKLNP